MTKQEQIEEMAVMGCVRNPQAHTAEECSKCDFKQGMCNAYRHAEALYEAGYRNTFTSDLANDTQKAYKEGHEKAQSELKTEIERLKSENEELTKVVSSKVYDLIDNTKEIADAREAWEKQAKIEVLNELKERIPLAMSKQYVCAQIDEMIKELIK